MCTIQTKVLFLLIFVVGVVGEHNAAKSQELDANVQEFFASCIGNWDVSLKNWGSPGAKKPHVYSGTSTSRLFGECWIISELTLENGAKTHSTLGFSARDKTFSGCSIVNFSPFIMQQNGAYDSATRKLTLLTKGKNVVTSEATEGKIELSIVDRTKRIYSIFSKEETGEFSKTAEIVFTRAKQKRGPETGPIKRN